MNPMIQSGTHPDADTLAAFVEQLLPADEREQILAHMSACARCREVAFLAQRAAEAEPVTPAASASTSMQTSRRSWLGGWRWAWVPAGVFAVLVGIATVLYFRHAKTETQMARNSAASNSLQQASATPAIASSQPAPPGDRSAVEGTMEQAVSRNAPVQHENSPLKAVKKKRATQENEMAMGAVAAPIAVQPDFAGGSIHGAVTARPQGKSLGGPMTNQLRQNEMQQRPIQQNGQPQQNLFQSRQNPNEPLEDKRVISGLTPASASETVTVEAEGAKARPGPVASGPPLQLSSAPVSGRSFELSSASTMQLKKAAKIALPSGAPVLSVAFGARRTIAIDTSGALFVSEDQGGHWTQVPTQWMGRAVLVRNLQAGTKDAALQALPVARFELVNDKLQSWTSADGTTWTPEIPAVK
jgi:hypothetical protein